jgi:RNA polymerase sigma factor (sigma-70 family)
MDWSRQFDAWTQRAWQDRVGVGAVFRVAVRRIGPGRALDLAEEAVQEAHRRAAKEAATPWRWATEAYYRHWLGQVAVNAGRDMLRRKRPRQFEEGEEAAVEASGSPPEDSEELRALLEQLPEEERCLLALHFDRDLGLREIADLLLPEDGRTDNARIQVIWRRVRSILAKLRRRWLEGDAGGSP